MTPEHASFLTHVLVGQLQHEYKTTAGVIAAVPDDRKDWKPDSQARSAWQLATHIASVDVSFLRGVKAGHFKGTYEDPPVSNARDLAAWYDEAFLHALGEVAAMSGDDLARPIEFYETEMPAVSYLMFCNNHMIHHRGQLSTYLRPMGAQVPPILSVGLEAPDA